MNSGRYLLIICAFGLFVVGLSTTITNFVLFLLALFLAILIIMVAPEMIENFVREDARILFEGKASKSLPLGTEYTIIEVHQGKNEDDWYLLLSDRYGNMRLFETNYEIAGQVGEKNKIMYMGNGSGKPDFGIYS